MRNLSASKASLDKRIHQVLLVSFSSKHFFQILDKCIVHYGEKAVEELMNLFKAY